MPKKKRKNCLVSFQNSKHLNMPEEAGGGCRGRPDGVANGGADKIDVNEGAEAASEDIFGLCC